MVKLRYRSRFGIEVDGKTYKVTMMDLGKGPETFVFVEVPTPKAILVSSVWRQVKKDGPTWKKVMAAYKERYP